MNKLTTLQTITAKVPYASGGLCFLPDTEEGVNTSGTYEYLLAEGGLF